MAQELRIRDLSKSFGASAAVRGVSFVVRPGEAVGVLGPSGAGKSTLLRMINRLIEPDGGSVRYGDTEVTALRRRPLRLWRARAAMIFQQFNLVGRLDVLTNVLIGSLSRHGFAASMAMHFSEAERTAAIRTLDRLGLAPQTLQRADTLSGGQQQRAAIAKALMQEPEIILADEPVASLDPVNARRVMEDLRAINRQEGISMVITLHNVETARTYCDRILGMRDGRATFDGPVGDLTDDRLRAIYGDDVVPDLDAHAGARSYWAGGALAAALLAAQPVAADWREEFDVIRIGVLAVENQRDRLERYAPFERYLEAELGTDVELFTAAAYDGVVQAIAADQIEFAFLGSSSYAAAWTETDGGVVPMVSPLQADGATGYYSIIVTRCDSGLASLADLQGKVLAFSDPDSTSGYAVPYYNLVEREGIRPAEYFAATPFSGGHENGVVGVVNGSYDAAATYKNNDVAGIVPMMVSRGMIGDGQVCEIWRSEEITEGPLTARTNLPGDLVAAVKAAVLAVPEKDPAAFAAMTGGESSTQTGWIEVDHARYVWIVEMRDWLRRNRLGN